MMYRLISQPTRVIHEDSTLDEFEAESVLSYILCTFAPGCGCVYRLGNGEYTVRMRHHGGYFLWNWRDACVFLQLVEDKGRVMDTKRRATSAGRERVTV